jgi:hypothetical protein
MSTFPWAIFFLLLAAGVIGTAAVMPYALSMNPQALEKIKETTSGTAQGTTRKVKLPLPVLLLISGAQNVVLLALAAFLGLLAGRQVGLGAPILQALVAGRPAAALIVPMLVPTILLGLATGLVMLALEYGYFAQRIPRELASMDSRLPFWKRALACFYGGIDEEILLRLFVMSGLVWLFGLVWQTPTGVPAMGAYWLANFLAALLFGAGHLPATAAVTRLTPMVIFRALLLNGIPGVVCGYLFMRYGLEAAMLAHFSLDIVIHLLAVQFHGAAERVFAH